jgi:hypothetical protein
MDKLKLTGRNLGRVFHSRLCHTCIGHAIVHITKQPNLKLKTRPKQLLGSLPLAFALPARVYSLSLSHSILLSIHIYIYLYINIYIWGARYLSGENLAKSCLGRVFNFKLVWLNRNMSIQHKHSRF